MSKEIKAWIYLIAIMLLALLACGWLAITQAPPVAPTATSQATVPITATKATQAATLAPTASATIGETVITATLIYTSTAFSTPVETPASTETPEPIAPILYELLAWAANLRICAGVECAAYGWATEGDSFEPIGECVPAADGGHWIAIPVQSVEYIHPNASGGQWVGQVLFINTRLLNGIDC